MKKSLVLFLAAALFCCFAAVNVQAAAYPGKRPVTIVVPWGAGGGSDVIARALAGPLAKELGTSVIVVNKPGGSGTIGTSFLAHAKPDGHTIGLINNTGLIHQVHLGGVDYTRDDLDPICLILRCPVALVVNSDSPIKNIAEFIQAAKEKNGNLTMGVAALNGGTHLCIEDFLEKADIKVKPMPFKNGGAGVLTALLGNHIESAVLHPSEFAGQYKAGKVRVLGVLDPVRLQAFPEVPTFKESGYDAEGQVWRCIVLPKGVPDDIKTKILTAIEAAAKDPGYLDSVSKIGDMPTWMGPKEFAEYLDKDDAKYLAIIKRLGIYQQNARKYFSYLINRAGPQRPAFF